MKKVSDPAYAAFSKMDFSNAKSASEVPDLVKLHAGKTRITIRVDNKTLEFFKAQAEKTGGNYQTLLNEALASAAQGIGLKDVVRDTVRDTLRDSLRELQHA